MNEIRGTEKEGMGILGGDQEWGRYWRGEERTEERKELEVGGDQKRRGEGRLGREERERNSRII
jgi:hypothetical protein